MLNIHTLILGPLENNTYILADEHTGQAAVVDPSFELEPVLDLLQEYEYRIRYILLTHSHFDHVVNALPLSDRYNPTIPIALHPSDEALWKEGSGADLFGINFRPNRLPDFHLFHTQKIQLGSDEIEVRQTPGHTPGSVCFVLHTNQAVLTGDLIFFHSVGRTDLKGGDAVALVNSIEKQIFTLPPVYRLLSGHGPESSVEEELHNNPFL